MKHWLILCAIIMAGLCLGQTYTLDIHAAIDGEPGYCDSLLSLAGAFPGAGTHDILEGDSVTLSINTTPIEVAMGTRDSCYSLMFTGVSSYTEDTTYTDGISISFVMTNYVDALWLFKRQVTFEVSSTHPEYGSPNPPYGINWIGLGDTVTASIDSISGDLACVGYNGTGSVPPVGFGYTWSGVIDEPSTIEWEVMYYTPPSCSLLVISEHGPCTPPASDYWNYFLCGTEIEPWCVLWDLSDEDLGFRYQCIGWRGTGCVPPHGDSTICPITCTTAGTIEWLWDTLYTGIEENSPEKPDDIAISTHPNPFNSSVTISVEQTFLSVQDDANGQTVMSGLPMQIEIFDINGRRVSVIANSDQPVISTERSDEKSLTNPQEISRQARNDNVYEFIWQPDETLPSGVYLVRATTDYGSAEQKITYLK